MSRVLFGRIVVEEADHLVAQLGLGDDVAHHRAAHLARADDQDAIDPLAGLAKTREDHPAHQAGRRQQDQDEDPAINED